MHTDHLRFSEVKPNILGSTQSDLRLHVQPTPDFNKNLEIFESRNVTILTCNFITVTAGLYYTASELLIFQEKWNRSILHLSEFFFLQNTRCLNVCKCGNTKGILQHVKYFFQNIFSLEGKNSEILSRKIRMATICWFLSFGGFRDK